MRTCATDADAHGLDIIRTYKLGSANMAYAAEQLKLPTIRWLGVRQSDLKAFGVSSRSLLPLTTSDRRMAKRLLSAPDKLAKVHPEAHAELTAMVKSGTKAEIECLHTVPGGLAHYLQTKLAAALKTTDDDQNARTPAAAPAAARTPAAARKPPTAAAVSAATPAAGAAAEEQERETTVKIPQSNADQDATPNRSPSPADAEPSTPSNGVVRLLAISDDLTETRTKRGASDKEKSSAEKRYCATAAMSNSEA